MTTTNETKNSSNYGILGLDIGKAGRWTRLLVGLMYLIPLTYSILINPKTLSTITWTMEISQNVIGFYILLLMYFIGIILAYLLVYRAFGERVFAKNNVWLNTLVFVGPPNTIGYWNIVFAPFNHFEMP